MFAPFLSGWNNTDSESSNYDMYREYGTRKTTGAGYLDDGTIVVVESGRDHVNEQVSIAVTSVLQTSAGRMVFGRYEATV